MKYCLTNNTRKNRMLNTMHSKRYTVEKFMETRIYNKLSDADKKFIAEVVSMPSYIFVVDGETKKFWARTSKIANYYDYDNSYDEEGIFY